MATPTPKPDGSISVHLKDGSRLVGKLVGSDKLKFKASFGEISVSPDSITGLRIATSSKAGEPTSSSVVLFHNGDMLTAEPVLANLKLETSWGEVSVAGKHVESIVMSTAERMVWVWDGRWKLLSETARQAEMARAAMPRPAIGYAIPTYTAPPATYIPTYDSGPYDPEPSFEGPPPPSAPPVPAVPRSG